MAQMIIESADSNGVAGNGTTFVKANNAFELKPIVRTGPKMSALNTPNDGKPVSYFRVYKLFKIVLLDP